MIKLPIKDYLTSLKSYMEFINNSILKILKHLITESKIN